MIRFFCWGYITGHEYVEYEEIHLFRACVLARSLREAHTIARQLAPVECNQVSVMAMPVKK